MRHWICCFPILALSLASGTAGAQTEAGTKSKDAASEVGNGKLVYINAGCVACHGADGKGTAAAPQIAAPLLPLEDLVQYVRKPSGKMAAVSRSAVSDAQLADVYAFLKSVGPAASTQATAGPPTDEAAKGKRLFTADGCYQCHDYQGIGAATGPRIGPPPISLSSFLRYVRAPSGNMPPYTAKIISDQDLTDIYAYLKSLPPPPEASRIPLLNP